VNEEESTAVPLAVPGQCRNGRPVAACRRPFTQETERAAGFRIQAVTDDPDPMPQPPPQPDLDACCGNGCDPCIFDLHDLAMDEYRRALRAWRERHPEAG
jgi:hypothetical protein